MRMRVKAQSFVGWCGVPLLAIASLAAASSDLRLVDAVKRQDQAVIHDLLNERADVNASQADGATALAWAAHWNDLETADLLIHAGANVNAANEFGVTPLSLACTNAGAAMIEKLLQAGANPNAAARTGETPLMTCARTGNAQAVKLLLARKADVNAQEGHRGQTALMWAAAEKHPEVVRVLTESGADIHARSNGGFTALLFSAQQGDLESAKLLLAAGADVNESSPESGSALVLATASGHQAMALFFLEKRANPNASDRYGITALHYAIQKGLSIVAGVRYDPLIAYLFRPNMTQLVKELLAKGANPNARIAKSPPLPATRKLVFSAVGATPFLLAAASYDVNLMRTLLAGGADPNLATEENTTALIFAAGIGEGLGQIQDRTAEDEKNSMDAVRLLLDLRADVNAFNQSGLTSLHGAAYIGADAIIQLLVERGAKVNVKDNVGQTPLSIAEKIIPPALLDDNLRPYYVHPTTAALLRKLGAEVGSDAVR